MTFDPFGLRAAITAHPWRTLVVTFAAGTAFGLIEPRRRFARMVAGTLASAALVVVREAVVRGLATHARSWIDTTERPHARA